MTQNDHTITAADVRGRALVIGTAPHDADAAAKLAAKIAHPWYRCQSLAISAEFSSGPKRLRLLDAAFAAAFEQAEPNRIVSVAFWPLRVLVADASDGLEARVRELIEVAEAGEACATGLGLPGGHEAQGGRQTRRHAGAALA